MFAVAQLALGLRDHFRLTLPLWLTSGSSERSLFLPGNGTGPDAVHLQVFHVKLIGLRSAIPGSVTQFSAGMGPHVQQALQFPAR